MIYAASEFSGVKQHKHGGTEAQHLQALKDMGVALPQQKCEMPKQLSYLFDIYMSMRFSKVPNDEGFSLMAKDKITNYDIAFYSKNSGLDFELWEIDALMSLDATFEKAVN